MSEPFTKYKVGDKVRVSGTRSQPDIEPFEAEVFGNIGGIVTVIWPKERLDHRQLGARRL